MFGPCLGITRKSIEYVLGHDLDMCRVAFALDFVSFATTLGCRSTIMKLSMIPSVVSCLTTLTHKQANICSSDDAEALQPDHEPHHRTCNNRALCLQPLLEAIDRHVIRFLQGCVLGARSVVCAEYIFTMGPCHWRAALPKLLNSRRLRPHPPHLFLQQVMGSRCKTINSSRQYRPDIGKKGPNSSANCKGEHPDHQRQVLSACAS